MAKDDPARDARLAEALRTNLRRRKAQQRAFDDPALAGARNDGASQAETPEER